MKLRTASRAIDIFGPVVRIASALTLMLIALPSRPFAAPTTAVATSDFLDSIGVVSSFPDRGSPCLKQ